MFEALENRRLLSGWGNDVGQLVVDGTNNQFLPDIINVKEDVDHTQFIITQNYGYIFTQRIVQAAGITSIEVNGYGGDDILSVDAGFFQTPTTINGGDGNDVMWGGLESDEFNGGAGNDTVLYTDVEHDEFGCGVKVTIDDQANDGVWLPFPVNQEHDNVTTSVENVVGTGYDDVIIGSDDCNVLIGLGGSDTIFGGDGDDYLVENIDAVNLPVEALAFFQGALLHEDFSNELHGDGGDDTIDARNGFEDFCVDGGEGRNGAFVDLEDLEVTSQVQDLNY